MATNPERRVPKLDSKLNSSVLIWLLDSDPSIRWQVMRSLTKEPEAIVAGERSRVAVEGWGARLLDLQEPDGNWGGHVYWSGRWTSTFETLMLMKDLGLDPADERARRAVGLVRDNVTWGEEFGDSPFFEGETEACINGRVLALGAYFGEISERLVDRLLGEQLEDGGWNCYAPPSQRSSFHTTICVLEGLLEYEKLVASGSATNASNTTNVGDTIQGITAVRDARLRGHEYLLERGLFRSLSTGQVIDPDWTKFSFPTRWYYDVLRGLDYLRKAGAEPDERVAEAIDLVAQKRSADGRWPLENPHAGHIHFDMEGSAGTPSRWNTLRALRVLDWYSA